MVKHAQNHPQGAPERHPAPRRTRPGRISQYRTFDFPQHVIEAGTGYPGRGTIPSLVLLEPGMPFWSAVRVFAPTGSPFRGLPFGFEGLVVPGAECSNHVHGCFNGWVELFPVCGFEVGCLGASLAGGAHGCCALVAVAV